MNWIHFFGVTIEFNYYMNSFNFCVIFMNSYIIWICLNASINQFVNTVYSDIPVMSDLKDYSDKDSFDFFYNNEEQFNSWDVDVDISADEHNPDNLLSQSYPRLFKSLSKILLEMAEK